MCADEQGGSDTEIPAQPSHVVDVPVFAKWIRFRLVSTTALTSGSDVRGDAEGFDEGESASDRRDEVAEDGAAVE